MSTQASGTEMDEADYVVTRKDGWQEFVNRPKRTRPDALDRGELTALSRSERLRYDETRKIWHANLGPIRTPQMMAAHDALDEIVDSSREGGEKVKASAVIDALPGLGKTTIAHQYAKRFHRDQVDLYGPITPEGHDRLPVAIVTLAGNTSIKGLHRALCSFYGLPSRTGNTDDLRERVLDAVLACRTKVVVVDDIHFLNSRRQGDRDVINHLKHLASVLPVVFVFVGINIQGSGFLQDNAGGSAAERGQVSRRWTPIQVPAFEICTEPGRRTWHQLLLGIEKRIVLADAQPGMLADDLSDYLFARSTGHFASLMALIQRGCHRAVRTGAERLDRELLDKIASDAGSEETRKELQSLLEQGLLTSRPRRSISAA